MGGPQGLALLNKHWWTGGGVCSESISKALSKIKTLLLSFEGEAVLPDSGLVRQSESC